MNYEQRAKYDELKTKSDEQWAKSYKLTGFG